MTTKFKLTSLFTALALLVPAPALAQTTATPSTAQSSAADRLPVQLVGSWRMTKLEFGGPNFQTVPYSGQIILTNTGNVAVQAMNPDTSAPDTAYTVKGYEAYYGTVTADRKAGTFTMTIQSAAARDLIGQELTRVFKVTGNTLVLTPVDASEGWRATYERY